MVIKTTFKDTWLLKTTLKRIRNYALNFNLYLDFISVLIQEKFLISRKKCWCQQKSRVVERGYIYIIFWIFFRYNCSKFHRCRICVTDFREENLFGPHPWAAPKRPILNRVKNYYYRTKTLCKTLEYFREDFHLTNWNQGFSLFLNHLGFNHYPAGFFSKLKLKLDFNTFSVDTELELNVHKTLKRATPFLNFFRTLNGLWFVQDLWVAAVKICFHD